MLPLIFVMGFCKKMFRINVYENEFYRDEGTICHDQTLHSWGAVSLPAGPGAKVPESSRILHLTAPK